MYPIYVLYSYFISSLDSDVNNQAVLVVLDVTVAFAISGGHLTTIIQDN